MEGIPVINPSTAKQVRTAKLDFNDSKNALLRIQYVDVSKDPSTPNEFCRLTVDHNGSGATKLIVFLDIGASSTDYTQYQFSAHTAVTTDPNGVDASPTHTQCTDLGALIDALNAIDGVKAYRLHAPADYSLDTNDFITESSVNLNGLFHDFLYKDVSEVLTAALRIGVPEEMDNGMLEIVRIIAYGNSDSGTDCTFKVSRDPTDGAAGESDEVELTLTRYLPDAAITTMWDFTTSPICVKGPILVEITAATSLAAGAYVIVEYRSAEY